MKVLYDHQCFDMERYGGISRYFCELMASGEIDYNLSLQFNSNKNIHEYNLVPNTPLYDAWDSLLMEHNDRHSYSAVAGGDYDVFHPTFFDDYYLDAIGDKPLVITIHDMVPELYHWKDDKIQKRRSLVKRANAIIAISENTKKDIGDIYGPKAYDKTTVIYHGTTKMAPQYRSDLPKYFLHVGTRDLYKGFIPMIIGISQYLLESQTHIICTSHEFNQVETMTLKELGISHLVHHKSEYNATLEQLYTNAIAMIACSEYEGFGLPILEAWSCNCRVIAKDASSFPEVVGPSIPTYHDHPGLIDLMILHEKYPEIYIREMEERRDQFNWSETAKQTLEVYKRVCI